jgi:hypothetical protein
MKIYSALLAALAACLLHSQSVQAQEQPTAFGSGFDVQDFYRPFTLEEITPANQQKWPFYKHVAVHWDKYAGHGTAKIMKSAKPTKLTVADDEDRVDLNTKWKDGQAFIDSLMATQVKGFIVVKDT